MKRKHIIYLLIFGLIVFISIPAFHLLKTYLNEDNVRPVTPKGFTNDASGLSLTKIDSIIDVPNSKVEIVKQLKEILNYSRLNKIPIHLLNQSFSVSISALIISRIFYYIFR